MITSRITTLRGLIRHVRINCDLTANDFSISPIWYALAVFLDLRSVLVWTSVWSGNLLSIEVISLTHCIVKLWGSPISKKGVTWPRFVRAASAFCQVSTTRRRRRQAWTGHCAIVPWHRRPLRRTQAPPGPVLVILLVITSNGKW